MSAALVNGLARILSAQLESLTKKSTRAGTGRGSDVSLEKLRTFTRTALECVQEVETAFRLQHQSWLAVQSYAQCLIEVGVMMFVLQSLVYLSISPTISKFEGKLSYCEDNRKYLSIFKTLGVVHQNVRPKRDFWGFGPPPFTPLLPV